MQTQKFTILDFEKLQDPSKRLHYEEIINLTLVKRNRYLQTTIKNYNSNLEKLYPEYSSSYYIKRANEIIIRGIIGRVPIKTATDKILLITSFVFPDNHQFMSNLSKYGIEKEACLNFSEEIKGLGFYDETKTSMILDLLIGAYFPNLDLIKIHYGTNNTGIIINKILEIAYLHPELLHTKEKS